MSTKPVLHYFDIGRLGRGEVVRLFLIDAGIDFEDKRYPFDETWPAIRSSLQVKGIATSGTLPVLEYKGHVLTMHLAILRYLSRDLNQYDGQTNQEKYLVDCVADIYNDWRAKWVQNIKGVSEEYKNKTAPAFYKCMEEYYPYASSGPYLLGNTITYADFAVYQAIDNDIRIGAITKVCNLFPAKDLKAGTPNLDTFNRFQDSLPNSMIALKEAMEARPRVADYLAENKG